MRYKMADTLVEQEKNFNILKLKKLILLYDSNNITIDGKVSLANTENVAKKLLIPPIFNLNDDSSLQFHQSNDAQWLVVGMRNNIYFHKGW